MSQKEASSQDAGLRTLRVLRARQHRSLLQQRAAEAIIRLFESDFSDEVKTDVLRLLQEMAATSLRLTHDLRPSSTQRRIGLTHGVNWIAPDDLARRLQTLRRLRNRIAHGQAYDQLALWGDQEEIGDDFRLALFVLITTERPDLIESAAAEILQSGESHGTSRRLYAALLSNIAQSMIDEDQTIASDNKGPTRQPPKDDTK